jgi:hypothetical protein
MTMTFLTRGGYVIQNGSLRIIVLKVQYQNAEYVKFKGSIFSKSGKVWYETKNYKLRLSAISHWKKVF